jgi:hypothetical protein
MFLKIIWAFAIVFFSPSHALLAQPNVTEFVNDSSGKEKSYVNLGVRYISDYYFMGRSDSAKAPYLTPSIGYYHRSGLFIRGSLSYLTASEQGRIDLYTLLAGYAYYSRKFAAGFSVEEYFFNERSYAVQAEMNTYLSVFAAYDIKNFLLYMDGSVGISDDADVFLSGEISRSFSMLKNRLRVIPAVAINGGSQQYYNAYFTGRSTQTGIRQKKGKHWQSSPNSSLIDFHMEESEKFKTLNYETSLMLSYKTGKVNFTLMGTWVFPQNPSRFVYDHIIIEETLKNGFFWSLGSRLRI